jgi:hypothetical protein
VRAARFPVPASAEPGCPWRRTRFLCLRCYPETISFVLGRPHLLRMNGLGHSDQILRKHRNETGARAIDVGYEKE